MNNDFIFEDFLASVEILVHNVDVDGELAKYKKEYFLGFRFRDKEKYFSFFFSIMRGQHLFTYRTNVSAKEQHRIAITPDKFNVITDIVSGLVRGLDVPIIDEDISMPEKRVNNRSVRPKKAKTKNRIVTGQTETNRLMICLQNVDIQPASYIAHKDIRPPVTSDKDTYTSFSDELSDTIFNYYVEGKFTDRERDMVFRRFGITSYQPQTLEDIGIAHGVTRERIRQILKRALYRPKHSSLHSRILLLIASISSDELVKYLYYGIYDVYGNNLLDYILSNLSDGTTLKTLIQDIKEQILLESKSRQREKFELRRSASFMSTLSKPPILNRQDTEAEFDTFTEERRVNPNNNTGIFMSRKNLAPLEYESGIEFRVLTGLEKNLFVKKIKMQSCKVLYHYSLSGYYFPDIQILTTDNEIYIIEVKPLADMMIPENIDKYDALKSHCTDLGYGYAMIDERNNSFESLISYSVDVDTSNRIMNIAKLRGIFDYRDFKHLQEDYGITWKDLLKVVYDNRDSVRYSPRPLRIEYKK